MKIAVNLTYLRDGRQLDGIGQFAINLLTGLQAIDKLNKDFHLFIDRKFQEKAAGLFPQAQLIPVVDSGALLNFGKYNWFFQSLYIDSCLVPYHLKREHYDLLYHPFNAVTDYISQRVPTLITLHDLFFKNYPAELSKKYLKYVEYRYRALIYKTAHIVVPSHFVKQDIIKYYPDINPDKITVIYNPIRVDYNKIKEYPLEKPYILCVNSMRNHKNMITLLKAFQLIEDKIEHHLVLTGAKDFVTIDPQRYAEQNQIKKLIVTGYVSDEERNYLYHEADLFVSPSCHEGFGMTPVEAALFTTPVLTTRKTSIPEVTCNMVNYYEPADDPRALAEQMLYLLDNRPPQEQLEEIKRKFASEYDIERIASLYYDTLRSLAARQNTEYEVMK
jgi:glycosyltransferase involved in cell wall biosynthesis